MSAVSRGFLGDQASYWNFIHGARRRADLAAGVGNPVPPILTDLATGRTTFSATPVPAAKGRRTQPGPRGADAAAQRLPPPGPDIMVSTTANALPSAAEASNAPNLLGEQGGPSGSDPFVAKNRAATAAATPPAAVAPSAMGVTQTSNAGPLAAVSTTHAPDAGVESAALERAKQLPSRAAFVREEAALDAAADVAPAAAAGRKRTRSAGRGGRGARGGGGGARPSLFV